MYLGVFFGLIIFVIFFYFINESVFILILLFIFGGGVLVVFFIILFVSDWLNGLFFIRFIFVGIVVLVGFSVILLFFFFKLNDEMYIFVFRWLVGNVWGRDWIYVFVLLFWIFILIFYVWLKFKVLNVLLLGDSVVVGFGVFV